MPESARDSCRFQIFRDLAETLMPSKAAAVDFDHAQRIKVQIRHTAQIDRRHFGPIRTGVLTRPGDAAGGTEVMLNACLLNRQVDRYFNGVLSTSAVRGTTASRPPRQRLSDQLQFMPLVKSPVTVKLILPQWQLPAWSMMPLYVPAMFSTCRSKWRRSIGADEALSAGTGGVWVGCMVGQPTAKFAACLCTLPQDFSPHNQKMCL